MKRFGGKKTNVSMFEILVVRGFVEVYDNFFDYARKPVAERHRQFHQVRKTVQNQRMIFNKNFQRG